MIEGCAHRHGPSLADLHRRPVAKTWRTSFEKATDPDAPEFKWLQDIADAMLPDLRAAFLRAIEKIRASIDDAALRQALDTGNVDAVMRALGLDEALPNALAQQISKPLEDAFIQAGRATPAQPAAPAPLRAGELGFRFDLTNPNSVRFLQSYDMGLIKQVSQETRDAVRRVVLAAFTEGGHPRQQAKQIRDLVGLTDRQAQAALNYRNALIEEERPADQIERMAAKYSDRLLRLRAETIARSETMRASNQGNLAALKQAADEGYLNRTTYKTRWLVTPDDRLCIYCAAIPAMNLGGVALGALYNTPFGPMECPPAHPNCRCILVTESF